MPTTCGDADTNSMLPVAAGTILSDVLLLTLPDMAVIATPPALLPAINVVVAVPLVLAVVEVAFDSVP